MLTFCTNFVARSTGSSIWLSLERNFFSTVRERERKEWERDLFSITWVACSWYPKYNEITCCQQFVSAQRYLLMQVLLQLSWTFEKQGTKLEWRWKCQPSADDRHVTASILDFLMDANTKLSVRITLFPHLSFPLLQVLSPLLQDSNCFSMQLICHWQWTGRSVMFKLKLGFLW